MPFKTRTFFKIVGEDGCDLYRREFNYADAIGYTVEMTGDPAERPAKPRVCTPEVMHASVRLTDALHHVKWHGDKFGGLRLLTVHGTPACKDQSSRKWGFYEFDVLNELDDPNAIALIFWEENQDRWIPYPPRKESMSALEACTIVWQRFLCGGRTGWVPDGFYVRTTGSGKRVLAPSRNQSR